MANVSSARHAAFRILLAVEAGKGHSDDLLRSAAVSALAPVDRNLATALVLGVLRWQLQLDADLRQLLARPNARLDAEVLIALRLGAFQLLHMDRIPARAAIDESVELTKESGHRFAARMVNAVLRKLVAEYAEKPRHGPESAAYPGWLTERWADCFGAETARAICCHGQSQPALTVRLVDPAAEAELIHSGIQLDAAEMLVAARTVLSGDITATSAYCDGRVRIQDEGSQLIAEIAGQGDAILDCCAAPGGKALILAERNPGARIVACEASVSRLAALRERLAPLDDRIDCRHLDAATLDESGAFDLVLADVPCSGTGTLGRNPEIRHRLAPDDFARQTERQRAILGAAIRATREGGRVVYSTCSLEPEENEQVIAAVLAAHENVRVLPLALRLEEMEAAAILIEAGVRRLEGAVTAEGYLRLIPGRFGTDGFFVAVLEKLN